MQQHHFDALIHGKEQKLNRSKKEEVVPRYKSISLAYYQEQHKDEELEERAHNFEPHIHYVVEQKAIIQGIRIFKGMELVLVTRQETIFLQRAKPTIAEGVLGISFPKESSLFPEEVGFSLRNNHVPKEKEFNLHQGTT